MSTTKRKKSTTRRKKNANTIEVERTVSPLKISIQGEEFDPDQIPSDINPEPDTHEEQPSEDETEKIQEDEKEVKEDEMVIVTRKKKSNPEEFEGSMREEKPKRFLRELKKPKLSPTGGRISPTRRIITATSEEEDEMNKPVKRVSWDKSVVQKDLERMDERLREEEEEREREKKEKEEREEQEEQERLEKEEREEREREEREEREKQEEQERLEREERERREKQEEQERLEREEREERERLEREEREMKEREMKEREMKEREEREREMKEREEREEKERREREEREEKERREREEREEKERREREEREEKERRDREEVMEQESRRERAERREREKKEQEERQREDEHLNRMMETKLNEGGFFERKPEKEMSRIEELEKKLREYEERERETERIKFMEKNHSEKENRVKEEEVEKRSPQMPPRRQEPPTTYSPLDERQLSNERHQTTGLPTPPPENPWSNPPENQWNGEKPILYKKVYMEDNTPKTVPQNAPLPFATNWKRPQYHLMDARQKHSYYCDFRIKYGLLNQQLPPDMQIPMFVPGEDLNIVHDRYERYLCQVLGHDEASMWNFILVLIYKGIEFVGTWLGIPCSGFTMYMSKKKHKMRNLLIQMGEQKYLTFSASWPVPAQILWTVVSSLAVFIVYGIIGKKFGDMGMKMAQEMGDYLLEMGSSRTVGMDDNGVPIIKEDPAFSEGPLNTISNFLEGDGANDMISNIFGMFKGRGASNTQKPAGGATNQRSNMPDINVDEIRRRKKEEEVLF